MCPRGGEVLSIVAAVHAGSTVSRKKRKRRSRKPAPQPEPVKPRRKGKWLDALMLTMTVCLMALAVWLGSALHARSNGRSSSSNAVAADEVQKVAYTPQALTRKARSLDVLLNMPPDQLAGVDIAEMNLLCAVGLPGAKGLDIDHCLATLDRWAARVKSETERHLYRVSDPRWAEHYRHSETYLRAEFLLQVLQEDLGVKYDMSAADNFSFKDSHVAFLHGMIPAKGQTVAQTRGGTCASMPVMYVAIGRRLGYPLRLVTTDGHIFVRWDGKGHLNPAWRDRFNIEGAGGGFSSYDDKHYITWPTKLTAHQVRANGHLESLAPREEFAMFLASRAHCGVDNGQTAFAARCYENAYRCDTRRPCYRAWFLDAARRSGYRPFTPALASLLARPQRPAVVRHPTANLGTPMPSATAAAMGQLSGEPHTPRIGPWRAQPITPGGPQLPAPPVPQDSLPRSHQPSIPGQPRR